MLAAVSSRGGGGSGGDDTTKLLAHSANDAEVGGAKGVTAPSSSNVAPGVNRWLYALGIVLVGALPVFAFLFMWGDRDMLELTVVRMDVAVHDAVREVALRCAGFSWHASPALVVFVGDCAHALGAVIPPVLRCLHLFLRATGGAL